MVQESENSRKPMGFEMIEEIEINNVIDKAILAALKWAEKIKDQKGLSSGAIKKIVKEIIGLDEKDTNVQKRIDTLHKKKILIDLAPSKSKKAKNLSYRINEELIFNYTCEPLPIENESLINEVPEEICREHTSELKEAIRAWIAFFPEPKPEWILKLEEIPHPYGVELCEEHLLFPDLINHLPHVDCNVCSKWEAYKADLKELEEMDEALLISIMNKILECFKGLNLRFIAGQGYSISDYECNLIHEYIYHLVLDLGGKVPSEDAFDLYGIILSKFKEKAKLREDDPISICWVTGTTELIRVPKRDREILIGGISNFITFLENIDKSELFAKGKDMITRVNSLREERNAMIRELNGTLFYHSFPGDCKYLLGS